MRVPKSGLEKANPRRRVSSVQTGVSTPGNRTALSQDRRAPKGMALQTQSPPPGGQKLVRRRLRILTAIQQGDAASAAAAMEQHLLELCDFYPRLVPGDVPNAHTEGGSLAPHSR